MVGRSLVFKTSVYATIVFFLAIPPTIFVARKVFETGRRFEAPGFVQPMVAFVEHELEREWTGTPPTRARLEEFEAVTHHALRFVPWGDPAIPAALATTDVRLDPQPHAGGRGPHHWARVDHAGKPVGALEFSARIPGGPGGPPGRFGPRGFGGPFAPDMAWLWILILMLIIVPPMYFWVLRPLRAMVAIANRLGGGDLDTPVAIGRRDEFGDLERAFEKMRVDLRGAIEQRERLLTDVSHEIRAPLARMMIALPLIQREGAPGPVTQIFENELRAVDDLVGDVLARARGGYQASLAWTKLDLADVARSLGTDRALFAELKGLALELDLEPAPAAGDLKLVNRAIGNLVDNALKYTAPGDVIRVVTRLAGGQAVVRVEDTGPGIAPEHLPLIFEPFYRPDTSRSRETGGSGLGLAIVKRIAEAHGGAVSVTSPPGGGTIAELRFPASS
jgi:signal transduction histidine kinase